MTLLSNDSGRSMIADTLAHFGPVPEARLIPNAGPVPPVMDLARFAPLPAGAPLYIGIAGAKRAGKDTLARKLQAILGLPIDSFAAPLRKFVAELAGMGGLDTLEVHKETPIPWLDGITARSMMQTVGTEWGRQMVHPDLWVRSLFARLPAGGIIPDVRFPNEAEAIRQRGGIVIRVSRAGTGHGDGHASETPLPANLVDIEVTNDSTPREMAIRVLADLDVRGVI